MTNLSKSDSALYAIKFHDDSLMLAACFIIGNMIGIEAIIDAITIAQQNSAIHMEDNVPSSTANEWEIFFAWLTIRQTTTRGVRNAMGINIAHSWATSNHFLPTNSTFRREQNQTQYTEMNPQRRATLVPEMKQARKNPGWMILNKVSMSLSFCSVSGGNVNAEGNIVDSFKGKVWQVSRFLNPIQYFSVPILQFRGIVLSHVFETSVAAASTALFTTLAAAGAWDITSFTTVCTCPATVVRPEVSGTSRFGTDRARLISGWPLIWRIVSPVVPATEGHDTCIQNKNPCTHTIFGKKSVRSQCNTHTQRGEIDKRRCVSDRLHSLCHGLRYFTKRWVKTQAGYKYYRVGKQTFTTHSKHFLPPPDGMFLSCWCLESSIMVTMI